MNMKLSWPLRKKFDILQSNLFGANPANYSRFGLAGHDGIDIMCPMGEDVIAPITGTTYVGWDARGWGLYVIITNNEGSVFLCHLQDNLVSSDTHVTEGQLIGHSDSTGNSSGPHLHLGLKVAGISNPPMKDFVDPLPYLNQAPDTDNPLTACLKQHAELVTKLDGIEGFRKSISKLLFEGMDTMGWQAIFDETSKLLQETDDLRSQANLADRLWNVLVTETGIETVKYTPESEKALLEALQRLRNVPPKGKVLVPASEYEDLKVRAEKPFVKYTGLELIVLGLRKLTGR